MKNILIVGCGSIGTKIYEEYKKLNPDRYDPYKNLMEKRDICYDIAFICVDTPMEDNGKCDLSQVECAIQETNAAIIVLRSTVPPTTTDTLIEKRINISFFHLSFMGQHSIVTIQLLTSTLQFLAARKPIVIRQYRYYKRYMMPVIDL